MRFAAPVFVGTGRSVKARSVTTDTSRYAGARTDRCQYSAFHVVSSNLEFRTAGFMRGTGRIEGCSDTIPSLDVRSSGNSARTTWHYSEFQKAFTWETVSPELHCPAMP